MRLFTAIPIPQNVKDKIQEVTKGRLPVSYVNTENAHITLNFFGEISEDKTELIKNKLPEILKGEHKIKIHFEKVQKFRNQIHIAIVKTPELMSLHTILDEGFRHLGFQFQNREYYPHIKLMNLHMDNVMFRERKIENFPQDEIAQVSFVADEIILFESRLHQAFAEHIALVKVNLND